jgi:hypothetical protein
MTEFTYIQTSHKTINKQVIKALAQACPSAVRRSKVKSDLYNKIVYVYDANGNSLGWAVKAPQQDVKITIKN